MTSYAGFYKYAVLTIANCFLESEYGVHDYSNSDNSNSDNSILKKNKTATNIKVMC